MSVYLEIFIQIKGMSKACIARSLFTEPSRVELLSNSAVEWKIARRQINYIYIRH